MIRIPSSVVLRLAGCLALAGCSATSPLIADKSLYLAAGVAVPLASVAAGVGAYFFYDPLAPNWEVEELRLTEDTYRYALKMKRYHTGGAGEAVQILKRRASQLQMEQGFGSYQILEYSEGIDSQTLGARRVAEGVVRLVRQAPAEGW